MVEGLESLILGTDTVCWGLQTVAGLRSSNPIQLEVGRGLRRNAGVYIGIYVVYYVKCYTISCIA